MSQCQALGGLSGAASGLELVPPSIGVFAAMSGGAVEGVLVYRAQRQHQAWSHYRPRAHAGRRRADSGAAMACRTWSSNRALSAPSVPFSTSQFDA